MILTLFFHALQTLGESLLEIEIGAGFPTIVSAETDGLVRYQGLDVRTFFVLEEEYRERT